MSLNVFKACSKGYSDRMFDFRTLCIENGYWSAYYLASKHPKSFNEIIQKMIRSRNQKHDNEDPEDIIASFKQREQKFNEMKAVNDRGN